MGVNCKIEKPNKTQVLQFFKIKLNQNNGKIKFEDFITAATNYFSKKSNTESERTVIKEEIIELMEFLIEYKFIDKECFNTEM